MRYREFKKGVNCVYFFGDCDMVQIGYTDQLNKQIKKLKKMDENAGYELLRVFYGDLSDRYLLQHFEYLPQHSVENVSEWYCNDCLKTLLNVPKKFKHIRTALSEVIRIGAERERKVDFDYLSVFLEEEKEELTPCKNGKGFRERTTELHSMFQEWMDEKDVPPYTLKQIKELMIEKGYEIRQTNGIRYYVKEIE